MPEAKEVRCSPLNAIPKNPQSRKAWCLDGLHEDLSGVAATTSSKGKRFPVIPALSKRYLAPDGTSVGNRLNNVLLSVITPNFIIDVTALHVAL
ncbi:hypothetical protein E4U23_003347 [Claviceps purpurea]|nr:hypothetical protein E4U11_006513 [Claviceps purpurea]KAG6162395.1 hypothetical protein E4U51_006416 [Claviceps purpurea]KAG6202450.1 hypothetical protein E4U50_006241 [Claviceps purpurea]KAG6247969.1 hypothetical protein E4U23_003347 [Claviceps purpurea]